MHLPRIKHRTVLAISLMASLCGTLSSCTPGSDATSPVPPAVGSPSGGSHAPALHGTSVHWGYDGETGPDYWGGLAQEYRTCATGNEQSPIDLPLAPSRTSDDLKVNYRQSADIVTNNGHSIELDPNAGNTLAFNNRSFDLDQIHFHAPAEHTVAGKRADAEFHFVHHDTSGNRLVLSVMATRGETNAAWQPFISATSLSLGETLEDSIDLSSLLPDTLSHAGYQGSLTTPPCSEGVQWLVLNVPITLDERQINTLDAAFHDNNRPVQSLNGRKIKANY